MLPAPPLNVINPQSFVPHPLLRNPHVMTVVSRYWPRRPLLTGIPTEARLFSVAPDSKGLGWGHGQTDPRRHPPRFWLHGLEAGGQPNFIGDLARKAGKAG